MDSGCGSTNDAKVSLTERDIPGASLCEKNPAESTTPQLKRWLQCRNAPLKGKKAAYIRNGWANNVINPDGKSSPVYRCAFYIA